MLAKNLCYLVGVRQKSVGFDLGRFGCLCISGFESLLFDFAGFRCFG